MLRIILIIGNATYLAVLGITFLQEIIKGISIVPIDLLFGVITITLLILNIYYLLGRTDLYLKRKRLEEEIKIQEAENKLKELRDKKEG